MWKGVNAVCCGQELHRGAKIKTVQISRAFSSPVSIIFYMYFEVSHKSSLSTLTAAQWGCFDLWETSVFFLVNHDGCHRRQPWTYEVEVVRGILQLLISSGCLENIRTNDHCFAKWEAVICAVKRGGIARDRVCSVTSLWAWGGSLVSLRIRMSDLSE